MSSFSIELTDIFTCELERAFKTPMLCDITQVHTGFLFMPKVTHCLDDENWGKIGGSRRVYMAKTLAFKGGEALLDTVLERKENDCWKIQVNEINTYTFGIHTFIGEWITEPIHDNQIKITYRYTLLGKNGLSYPLQWFTARILWKIYMRRVLNNIKQLAINRAPYLFD